MPDPDGDELRELQQKAYGRSGGLTDAEAARLRELESQVGPAEPAVTVVPLEAAAPALAGEQGASPVPEGSAGSADGSEDAPRSAAGGSGMPDSTWRMALRRHWAIVAAASALLLIVGLATGWALFAPRVRDAVALTDAEVQRKLELDEENKFDEGTLRAVARDDDALVWFGTKDDGKQKCIVLDVAELSQTGCTQPDRLDMFGLSATVSLPPEDDAPEGDFGTSISAYAMMSTSDEPMVSIQRWDADSSMLEQYDEDVRPRAEELMTDEGFAAGLSLVGYVRDQPVWVASRFSDTGSNDRCLIVDGLDAIACGDESTTLENGLTVASEDENGRSLLVMVQFTNWGNPYLTITENVGDASTTVIDTETGDPIEVTTPQTDPDG